MRQVDDPRLWRLLLIAPLAVSLLLFAVPQYFFITTSFHQNLGYGRIGDAFTLDNYHRIFTDSLFVAALVRTVALSAITALVCLVLGFPVAYVLARAQSKWTSFLLGLLVTATFITPVVKDLGLIILLSKNGVVNGLLGAVGAISAPVVWLGSEAGVVIGLAHYTLPLIVLMLHTIIQTVPRSLEDAAHAHGASRLRVFYGVIIPIVKPGLVAAALMVFNLAAGAFTTPALLGGGRVLTFSILIQRAVILDVDYPFAAALSTLLLVFVFALNLLSGYLMIKQTRARPVAKKPSSKGASPARLTLKGA
ncbi:ABC transporter permease [Variovorax sp. PBL-E5]|uniref:ABC transporter permease n=1 Tax=Variovorax sp. PBL-E5 TaxID=434014 RepID=UPI001317B404|nr:ABC transporter permease [Variovorax sp. PBL-E5]VTU45349.1 Spermidine/putrescine transport system permease protein PotB [Variovorax sp. PBL-E5]